MIEPQEQEQTKSKPTLPPDPLPLRILSGTWGWTQAALGIWMVISGSWIRGAIVLLFASVFTTMPKTEDATQGKLGGIGLAMVMLLWHIGQPPNASQIASTTATRTQTTASRTQGNSTQIQSASTSTSCPTCNYTTKQGHIAAISLFDLERALDYAAQNDREALRQLINQGRATVMKGGDRVYGTRQCEGWLCNRYTIRSPGQTVELWTTGDALE